MKTSTNTHREEKVKQSWYVDNWMKVIFRDQSRIYIGQSDDDDDGGFLSNAV